MEPINTEGFSRELKEENEAAHWAAESINNIFSESSDEDEKEEKELNKKSNFYKA
jgi:hypothetical protein